MARRTRILHVLNYYAPHLSGLTEYARLVAEALAAEFEVTVLAMRHSPDLAPEELLRGVRVRRASPLVKLHKGILSLDFLRQYRRLAAGADVAHLHLPMLEAGLLARLTPASTPLVMTYQCDLAPARRWSAVDRLAVAAVRASGRASAARARAILVSSVEYAAGSPVIGRWREKWVEVFPPDNAPPGLEPSRLPESGPPTVGFLGRFVEEKGIDVILDAVPLVLRELPATRFILAGDYESVPGGSQMGRLRARLQEFAAQVEVPGKLPTERIFDFYRSLDLFLLPSINAYEAFGIVQIEAMKSGVGVIASDLRGVRVPVGLTGCGAIVPPGDSHALAQAILAGLRGTGNPTRAEIAARAWKTFSNGESIDRIRGVYQSLVA